LTGNSILKSPWLIDSGASTHMTGDEHILERTANIPSVVVDLPNGAKTVATKQGTSLLGKNLVLKHTLLVPSLRCNLLSVSRICKDLNCTVLFDENTCILQDRTTRIPIGMGKQRHGVYYFQGTQEKEERVCTAMARQLWHYRMGHPSKRAMPTTMRFSSSDQNFDKYCETCMRAKQTRIKFALSHD